MGAGCYYTNREGAKSFWVNIDFGDEEDGASVDLICDEVYELIHNVLVMDCNYDYRMNNRKINEYCNGLFEINTEGTYYGDGIVIHINPIEDVPQYSLAVSRYDAERARIAKRLKEAGLSLSIATSGFTSSNFDPK